jgi:hypothetical protein
VIVVAKRREGLDRGGEPRESAILSVNCCRSSDRKPVSWAAAVLSRWNGKKPTGLAEGKEDRQIEAGKSGDGELLPERIKIDDGQNPRLKDC